MLNIISSSRYKINRLLIKQTVGEMLAKYDIPSHAVLNIVFIGRKKMKTIAAKYKREDVALPVLSFSYFDNPKKSGNEIGEVMICYPQAVLLAAERDKRVDKIILQLVEHGVKNILK